MALLSVPYIPLGEMSFIDMMQALHKDRFFYQVYFQREGLAEAELEADVRAVVAQGLFRMVRLRARRTVVDAQAAPTRGCSTGSSTHSHSRPG